MRILIRYKDINNKTIGYKVLGNNGIQYVKPDTLKVLYKEGLIDNAKLLDNGEFRAVQGKGGIKTIVSKTDKNTKNKLTVVNNSMIKKSNESIPKCNGIEFINDCKYIRQKVKSNKIKIDISKHKSNEGNNTQMFRFIRECGWSVEGFIKKYLSNIQPYSLQRFKDKSNIGRDKIWVCDVGYKIQLLIKVHKINNDEIIVISFHESNIIQQYKAGKEDFKCCAVIVDDSYGEYVKYTVQRGFLDFDFETKPLFYNNGVAIVEYSQIEDRFRGSIHSIIRGLYDDYSDDNTRFLKYQPNIKDISFTSFGYSIINKLSLLIDVYSKDTSQQDRKIILNMTYNILSELPDGVDIRICKALESKYGSKFENKLYNAITGYIKGNGNYIRASKPRYIETRQ